MDRHIGYDEASATTGIKKGTLYWLVAKNKIPHVRVGPRLVLFSERALAEWFASHASGPNAPAKATDERNEGTSNVRTLGRDADRTPAGT